MISKPKPIKKEKTVEDRIFASRQCKKHGCPKIQCANLHRKPTVRAGAPERSRTWIRVKPRAERRVWAKTERTLLEHELDTVCSKIVRLRNPRCVTCGTTKQLECSHFVGRADSLYLRWDTEANLNTQCKLCNNAHNDNEYAYEAYMLRKHGRIVVDSLRRHNGKTYIWSVPELRDLLETRKRELNDLTG